MFRPISLFLSLVLVLCVGVSAHQPNFLEHETPAFKQFLKSRNEELAENPKTELYNFTFNENTKTVSFGRDQENQQTLTIQDWQIGLVKRIYPALFRDLSKEYADTHPNLSLKSRAVKLLDGVIPLAAFAFVEIGSSETENPNSALVKLKNLVTTSIVLKFSFRMVERFYDVSESIFFTPLLFRLSKDRLKEEVTVLSINVSNQFFGEPRRVAKGSGGGFRNS